MTKIKINFIILGIFQLVSVSIFSQSIDLESFNQIKARNIGPAGMSGRVTAIDVDLSNSDRIFVGTASGGIWLSENGGTSWKPIFDKQSVQSIGAIKINQSNPSQIWVGTGEGNPRNSQNSGAGVYLSIDGGKTWQLKGLENTKVIHRILIDESQDGLVYVGAQGSAWGESDDRGIYKSSDGGETWDKILFINNRTGVGDLIMDPVNPKKMVAAMWEFGRKPWTFNSGGEGSGLYLTYDGGKNWKKLTAEEGLPKGNLGRIGIAVSRSKPDILYALIEAKENALYKSSDGGEKWNKISTHENIGNRPFYYSEIYVDPQNENRVYSLWSYVSKSEDGGKTFDVIADYGNAVHPDHHAFWINPDDPGHLIDGNDGGLNISYDMGSNWRFVNNLPVGQFYHVNIDDEFPYNVYGGMQDNGSWVGPSFVLKSGGITNHDWQEVYFGDGFDVAPHPENSELVYAMSQGGNLGLVNKLTGEGRFIKPNHPGDVTLRYNWNAPLALDPFNACGLYYGSQFVHYSTDCGESWTIISDDLTTNDTTKQRQDISGGLTIDATNAENNTTIIAISPSPVDAEVIWAGTDDGKLQLTRDGGASWTDLYSRLPDAPQAGWIPQIEVSKTNSAEAFVVLNNYRQNDWSAYVYHTSDLGQSWKRLVNNDDCSGFVTSVLQDEKEPNLLFLGTDVGLFISFDYGENWHKWTHDFPSVQIRDMKIQSTFGDLVLATFGRAFWVIDEIGPFRELSKEDFTTKEFDLISSSPGYLAERRSYQGIRFYGQGEFAGDNKDTDALLSVWIKPKKEGETSEPEVKKDDDTKNKEKGKKKSDDKITFTIISQDGDTVRRFSRKVTKKGLVRFSWGLEVDGVRGPSRRVPAEDADLPGGGSVLPGEYKVIASWEGQVDSLTVQVRLDPRLDISEDDLIAMKESRVSINMVFKLAAESYEKIRKARKSLDLIEKLTETLQDSTKKDVVELNKKQGKKLDELEELFFNKQGLKGIQRNPKILTASLFGARRYLGAYGRPGSNATIALSKAEQKTNEVISAVDDYLNGDWTSYKETIKSLNFEIFNE